MSSVCLDTMSQMRFQHQAVGEYVEIIKACSTKPPLTQPGKISLMGLLMGQLLLQRILPDGRST